MKESLASVFRIALTAIGAYLVGKNLLGQPIDSVLWQEIVGVALALFSTIWGIADKSATIEQIQSAVRSVLIVVGGLLVASGKIKEELLTAIIGIVTILIPAIQSETAKRKVAQIDSGRLPIAKLKSK